MSVHEVEHGGMSKPMCSSEKLHISIIYQKKLGKCESPVCCQSSRLLIDKDKSRHFDLWLPSREQSFLFLFFFPPGTMLQPSESLTVSQICCLQAETVWWDWGKTRPHSMHSSSSEQMSSFHMKGFLQLSKLDIVIIISTIVDVFCTLVFQFNKASTAVFLTSMARLCFQMEQ